VFDRNQGPEICTRLQNLGFAIVPDNPVDTPDSKAWADLLNGLYPQFTPVSVCEWAAKNRFIIGTPGTLLPNDKEVSTHNIVEQFLDAQPDVEEFTPSVRNAHTAALLFALTDLRPEGPPVIFLQRPKTNHLQATAVNFGGDPPHKGVRLDQLNTFTKRGWNKFCRIVATHGCVMGMADPTGRNFIYVPASSYLATAAELTKAGYKITEVSPPLV